MNIGIPNNMIYSTGSALEKTTFIDEEDGPDLPMDALLKVDPFMTPRFTRRRFKQEVSLLEDCLVYNQSYVTRDEKLYWSGCVDIDRNSNCMFRSLDQNHTHVMFNTWFETRNVDPGNNNFALPLQCSYYLNYNLDLYLGTVTTDEWGNPIYSPDNNGTIPGCPNNDTNPDCDDSGRTPGFIIPQLYTVENITLITTSATDKGTFPVYMFLYEDGSYEVPYTIAPIKDETERLWLETGVINPLSNAVIQTRQCWASPTADSQHESVFMLIDEYCPTQDAIDKIDMSQVNNNGLDIQNRFDSLVYQFVGSKRVYIFCKIRVCITTLQTCDVSNVCDARRKKRELGNSSDLSYEGDLNSNEDNKIIRIGPLYPEEFASNNSRPIVMIEPEYTTRLVKEVIDVVMKNVNENNNSAITSALMNFPTWSIILVVVGMLVTVLLLVLFVFNYARGKSNGSGKM